MISITKDEKMLLEKLYPQYKYPRTMKQRTKRHHYFCTESEELMRTIADTNSAAAELVREFDRRRAMRERRRRHDRSRDR